MQLVANQKQHLIHGFVRVNGKPTSVLYFDDLKVGIAGFVDPRGGTTVWSRFSAHMLPNRDIPSLN
jgi:hypothetical protein